MLHMNKKANNKSIRILIDFKKKASNVSDGCNTLENNVNENIESNINNINIKEESLLCVSRNALSRQSINSKGVKQKYHERIPLKLKCADIQFDNTKNFQSPMHYNAISMHRKNKSVYYNKLMYYSNKRLTSNKTDVNNTAGNIINDESGLKNILKIININKNSRHQHQFWCGILRF